MNIPVIFENEDVLVLDKPSGMVVHPFDFSEEGTVLHFLEEKYPNIFEIENTVKLQDGRVINLGGLVHKLDRDTSGVLLVAKNRKIFNELKDQFLSHTILKKYIACVEGIVEQDDFVIDAPLGREKKGYKQTTNPVNPRGLLLNASTQVHVLARNEEHTMVELVPRTGRTHQLRAHMASIGHPIIGDIAYGSKRKNERIMLHASSLSFSMGGGAYTFTSSLPDTFICSNTLSQRS